MFLALYRSGDNLSKERYSGMILSGWKEIAGYLHCGVRTVQRWEERGLPVHRPVPYKRSHVIAHSEELDRWIRSGGSAVSEYPKLTASLTTAQKLYCENRARVAELHERVLRLSEEVAELKARRNRSCAVANITARAEIEELAG